MWEDEATYVILLFPSPLKFKFKFKLSFIFGKWKSYILHSIEKIHKTLVEKEKKRGRYADFTYMSCTEWYKTVSLSWLFALSVWGKHIGGLSGAGLVGKVCGEYECCETFGESS